MLYLKTKYHASTNRQNKGNHHTVNEAPGSVQLFGVGTPPPASLGNHREEDFHLRELPVVILQVLLDPCYELHTLDVPTSFPPQWIYRKSGTALPPSH